MAAVGRFAQSPPSPPRWQQTRDRLGQFHTPEDVSSPVEPADQQPKAALHKYLPAGAGALVLGLAGFLLGGPIGAAVGLAVGAAVGHRVGKALLR